MIFCRSYSKTPFLDEAPLFRLLSPLLGNNNNKGVIILSASTCNGKRDPGGYHATGVSAREN
jgi:hypothetical protein